MANTNFATAAQIAEIENTIIDILNAGESGEFGGAISDKRRSPGAITSARRKATMEIVKAVAMNPAHGFYQTLSEEIEITSGMILPPFLGALCVPQIQAFDGADFDDGLEERPEMIDFYRSSIADNLSQTLNETALSAHNLPYMNMPSRGAGRYSIRSNVIKFTGFACNLRLVLSPPVDETSDYNDFLDKKLPAFTADAAIGLSFQYLVKEGDNIFNVAQGLIQFGKSELNNIRGGAMAVEAVPKISERQRIIR